MGKGMKMCLDKEVGSSMQMGLSMEMEFSKEMGRKEEEQVRVS